MRKLGLISIGQSCDGDFVPVMREVAGPGTELVVMGALDGLDESQLAAIRPSEGEHPVVTQLADGRSVRVSKASLVPLINEIMNRMAAMGIKVACLMCTGSFQGLVEPEGFILLGGREAIDSAVRACCPEGSRIGVMVPLESQEPLSCGKYREMGFQVVPGHGNPYGAPEEIRRSAAKFSGCRAVVLHCMGYTREHRQMVAEACGAPVLEANAIIGRLASELL